jgi:hypothetical protein
MKKRTSIAAAAMKVLHTHRLSARAHEELSDETLG